VKNEKDNFHILIFGIDNMTIFDTVISTILIKLSFSKGGGGWDKAFNNFPLNLEFSSCNLFPLETSILVLI
jgi:hypothetical protein